MHLFPASRMDQRKLGRMQALPMNEGGVIFAKFMIGSTVYGIAQQRMTETCHMHADLMRAPRFEPALHMAHARKAL